MATPRSPYNPLTYLASLRLTIVLLSLSIFLIFVGTLAQVDQGIWWVVEEYFRSLYVWVPLDVFRPVFWPSATTPWDVSFIFPGGFLLLGLLVVNLIAAHAVRYKVRAQGGAWLIGWVCMLVGSGLYALTVALPALADMIQQDVILMLGIWALPTALITAGAYMLFGSRKGGIVLVHLGLILLLLGEFVTGLAADEGRMQITERGSSNQIMDVRAVELAFITPAGEGKERHVVVPEHLLERSAKTGEPIEHPDLPVSVVVDGLMANSDLRTVGFAGGDIRAVDFSAQEIDTVSGTEAERSDMPSAYITLRGGGETLGRQLVSVFELVRPVVFEADGRPWRVVLRFKRTYLPYSIQLHDFRNDTFTGSNVARNFSSDLRVVEADGSARDAFVKMNQPLRYDGKAFFQAGFLQHPLNRNTGTILQVADNPGSWIPYLSCVIVTVGLCGQFGASLFRYGKRTAAQGVRQPRVWPAHDRNGMSKTPQPNTMSTEQELGRTFNGLLQTALPVGLCVVLALWLLGAVFTARGAGGAQGFGEYDYAAFGAVPVSEDGRVKPLDTLARNTLLQLSGKQSLVEEMLLDGEGDEGRPAIVWLAEVFAQRPEARQRAVFRIDDPGVLGLMGLTVEDGKYFSMDQIAPHLKAIEDQAQIALVLPDDERSRFQEHVIGLRSNIGLLFELQVGLRPHVLPPSAEGEDWVPLARSGTGSAAVDLNPAAMGRATALSWSELVGAYRDDEPGAFNSKVKAHRALVDASVSGKSGKAAFEQKFNAYRPFVKSIVLYILAGLMGLLGLLFRPMLSPGWARSVWRSGVGVLVLALVVHTAALIVRMWLQGRPPVTNLYSSAVFIGWAVVLFAVVMEVISRLGIASLAASIVGVSTLFIAHNLAKDGDTMGVMQAVLDSNFWLGTHVIAVTLGYAATFFAGFLALLYIVLGMATPALDKKSARLLSGMVYAVICFALLFSFVGTVLGGIWADQSWGRFWGWDPKENGAIMIVLMNAIILHARWGHLVRDRGLMCLAVSGNIITAWSWFGTNLLEVGLHSYGFTEGAMTKLMVFAALNLLVIGVALAVPTKLWWSFRLRPSAGEPRSPKPQPAS